MIRRSAFKFSENDMRHWLMQLVADRINMVEGLGDDLMKGHVPNIFAEMGWKSEFKYNRAGAIKKIAVASAAVGLGYYLLKRRNQ